MILIASAPLRYRLKRQAVIEMDIRNQGDGYGFFIWPYSLGRLPVGDRYPDDFAAGFD